MLVATLITTLALHAAPASQIYKCRLPSGVVSFQEKACARGTHLKTIVVPTVPAAPAKVAQISASPLPAPSTAQSSTLAAPATTSIPPATPAPNLPPAAYYRCTAFDGKSYYSASPLPRRREVPAADVLDPNQNLGPAGAGQVWVEDSCIEVPLSEACAHYQQQLEFVIASQRNLTGLDLKRAIREQQRLSTIRGARCRGG